MIKKINYNGIDFVTILTNDDVLFWGKEICNYLEYDKTTKVADVIKDKTDDDERVLLKPSDIKQFQNRFKNDSEIELKINNRGEWFVTETGLYALILGSRKPEAKEFKKWVKGIIKELRKQAGLEAYEAFRMMDKDIQKKCASFIAEHGNIGEKEDNIVMNKNVNEITSKLYHIEPALKKSEMEQVYPQMLIDRQHILQDYCTLFEYTNSHKTTKEMISKRYGLV